MGLELVESILSQQPGLFMDDPMFATLVSRQVSRQVTTSDKKQGGYAKQLRGLGKARWTELALRIRTAHTHTHLE